MDTTQMGYLVVIIVSFLAAMIGLYLLSKKVSGGVVLAIGVLLYLVSSLLDPGNSRDMRVVTGVLGATGIGGVILGLLDIRRNR